MWSLILFAAIKLHSKPSLWGHSSLLHPPSTKIILKHPEKRASELRKKHAHQQHTTQFKDLFMLKATMLVRMAPITLISLLQVIQG